MHRKAVFAAMLLAAGPLAAETCTPVHFAPGTSSIVLHGSAPADDVLCYAITMGAGQHAELKVLTGNNTVFGIDGLIDDQVTYAFTTTRKTYHIDISQQMRALEAQHFTLSVTVK
jgi:hypothetical protein